MSKLVHKPKLVHSFGKLKERLASPETEVTEPCSHVCGRGQGLARSHCPESWASQACLGPDQTIRTNRIRLGLGQVTIAERFVVTKRRQPDVML